MIRLRFSNRQSIEKCMYLYVHDLLMLLKNQRCHVASGSIESATFPMVSKASVLLNAMIRSATLGRIQSHGQVALFGRGKWFNITCHVAKEGLSTGSVCNLDALRV